MYRDHSIGVVVPAYNEAGFIGDVIREMPAYVDSVFVVDDCSSDTTWDDVLEAARVDSNQHDGQPPRDTQSSDVPLATDGSGSVLARRATVHDAVGRVTPIQHHENLGAGGAIKTGYLAALEDGLDVTATVDGDGQMDLSQLSRLLDPIVDDDADYSKGNRLLYPEYRGAMPTFRFVGNTILTFLTKIASGYWKTMDPQNGYTAISHQALATVGVENMYEYYGYCNDLLVKLNVNGMRVADVAMPAVYGDEESSITYTRYVPNVSAMLFRNFLWRLKAKYLVLDFHPLALFYLLGAGTIGVGALGFSWTLYAKYALNDPLFVRTASSLLLVSIGSMFITLAMVFDLKESEDDEMAVFE
ncbi:glycosyltransferase family 2 protein [Natrarchaeobius halalkaliphilus]|uniref:Glycosyltransferase family 2 protein n=1 Tax=Natrarchaeobius halalkaliphilus TaxID=1679091 RepID=A0A3N6LMV4_9EURY|nr:glycosyltransferase family 2 protein [Natrarchaeobius halalkaliphilus]RQG89217.1 glycosyltransferase family 2 protein [Natrarchaeobius halalkaliphilus]